MRDLEDVGRGTVQAQPLGCGLEARRLVPQGLEQPSNAEPALGGAEEDRRDLALAHLGDQIGEDHVLAGRHVAAQLLQQDIVVFGQLLQHVKARVGLGRDDVAGHVDARRGLAGPVDEGALQRQIDEAARLLAFERRQLSHHKRGRGDRLQRLDQRVQPPARLVDLVDEQRMRQSLLLQGAQDGLGQHGLVGRRVDHHDRLIDDG